MGPVSDNTRPPRNVNGGETWDQDPAWSPDGRTIYFTRAEHAPELQSSAGIFAIRSDGSGLRLITYDSVPTYYGLPCLEAPAPEPKGRVIAFWVADCERLDGRSEIRAVTGAGRRAQLPFRFPAVFTIQDPAWAPNGHYLAYWGSEWSWRGERARLYVSSDDGNPPRSLATAGSIGDPAWSPDGTSIAFVSRARLNLDTPSGMTGTPNQVRLIRANGTGLRRLTHDAAWQAFEPVWLRPAR